MNLKSRKTVMAVIAVIGVALTFLKEQFGLAIEPTSVLVGLTALLVYIFGEAKLDAERIQESVEKFKDPKFWLAFVSTMLVAVNEAFGLKLPVEVIVTVLTGIMGILFRSEFKKATSA